MYHNVLDPNEYARQFLSEQTMSCSFAMDDGGRCLLDVISDPKLLQSFLESGSDENSKDPQDGTSSESAAESPQVPRSLHSSLANHLPSTEHLVEQPDQMGYSFTVDGQALLAQAGVCSTSSGVGGVSIVVATSGAPTYQHTSTVHHLPQTVTHSPASTRSVTPSSHNIKSPSQGPSSVHSMPPPSPLQQTRSPLPSHTPSPAPSWSPAPAVLSPAPSRTQVSMPSVAFQQSHNQILSTSCSMTQLVTALAAAQQQPIGQKLAIQQQQQLFLQQPAPQPPRLAAGSPVVTTSTVTVQPPMVQLIHAPAANIALSQRTQPVRHIQPKPQQILPKPATCTANQFVSPAPAPKQAPPPPPPVSSAQRTVGVGLPPGATSQLVIGQSQPGVFSGPQGTFLLNQIIPGMGQSPILIQGNLGNLANINGLQLTLRPQSNPPQNPSLSSSNSQNNATLIAALQGPSQHAQTLFAQTKSPIHGQQTIVIPNNIANAGLSSQNINLTSAAIPNSGILSSSAQNQGFLAKPNFILSPRVVGPNQGLQLQQIQTPSGPIFAFASPGQTIAVPHLPHTLGNAQLGPVTLPMHSLGQGVLSGLSLHPHHAPPSALQQQQQSLFGTAVPFTSHLDHSSVIQVPQPLAPPHPPIHVEQQHSSPPKPTTPKPSKVPSVNLEELLKEHGIVPENSPLPSPESNSPVMEEPVPQPPQPLVPSQQLIAALQSQQVILEQPHGHPSIPQLKLAFTPDGSVILQPDTSLSGPPTRLQQFVPTSHIQSRVANSLILPATSSVESTSTSAKSHSALLARLNSSPAVPVPDLTIVQSTTTSITTTTITTTATQLVPLTVQSLNVNSTPITSSYVVQRTSNALRDRVLVSAKETHHQTPVILTSSSSSSRGQPNGPTLQTLLIPAEQHKTGSSQSMLKPVVQVATSSVQSTSVEQPRCALKEVQPAESSDGAVVVNHNHSVSPNVPNNNILLQRLKEEIKSLVTLKSRSGEQQKILTQLMNAHKKLELVLENKNSHKSQANKNMCLVRVETDIEKFLSKLNATRSPKSNDVSIPQTNNKTPVILAQPPKVAEKQNSKISNAINLVNLLKQNHNHTPVKPIAPATTTISTPCDSTTTTVASSITTTHQKCNPSVTTSPARVQISNHQNNKSCEVTQKQVIIKAQPSTSPKEKPHSKPVISQPQLHPKVVPQTQQPVKPIQLPHNVTIKSEPLPPVKRITVPKQVLINDQLSKDQDGAVNPDVRTPFRSKIDACTRLLQYHVYDSKVPSDAEINKADEMFNIVSEQLMNRVERLHRKFNSLLMTQSMITCVPSEQVLLERLFLEDEQTSLEADRATVAEGKDLSLPPPPESWLPKMRASCQTPPPPAKEEPPGIVVRKDNTSSDSSHQTNSSSDQGSDNLEAPVIDSCEDIVHRPLDENLERSPPTLKRIVIKPRKWSAGSDSEQEPRSKKLKFNNNVVYRTEERRCPPPLTNHNSENESRTNHKYSLLTREAYHSENKLEDMMSELQKEFDMSPPEMVVDVDFDPATGAADFEPPVPRTEESCDSNILYNNRTNCADKYDFDLLACSTWPDEFVQRQSNESDLAVESIVNHHHDHPSDLDLSGFEGLEDQLDDDSQECLTNGIQDDDSRDSSTDLPYIDYRSNSNNKSKFMMQANNHQVQSAIKSIMTNNDSSRHSYFDDADFLRHQMGSYTSPDMTNSHHQRRDPDLEEAVRSILL